MKILKPKLNLLNARNVLPNLLPVFWVRLYYTKVVQCGHGVVTRKSAMKSKKILPKHCEKLQRSKKHILAKLKKNLRLQTRSDSSKIEKKPKIMTGELSECNSNYKYHPTQSGPGIINNYFLIKNFCYWQSFIVVIFLLDRWLNHEENHKQVVDECSERPLAAVKV